MCDLALVLFDGDWVGLLVLILLILVIITVIKKL